MERALLDSNCANILQVNVKKDNAGCLNKNVSHENGAFQPNVHISVIRGHSLYAVSYIHSAH